MAEVQDFISETLKQILTGIENARTDKKIGDAVAPHLDKSTKIDPAYQVAWHDGHFWTSVHFDIAVTAKSVTEGGGKLGFSIPVIEIGAKLGGNHERTTEGVSRIQFSVPLRLPKKA